MKTNKLHEFFFFENNHFFSVCPDESIGYGIAEMPDFLTWVSAYKCKNCGNVVIFEGSAELVETEPREMGSEYFFHAEDYRQCSNCQQGILVRFDLTYYGLSWILEDESKGVEGIGIEGLDWLAKQYWKSESVALEKEMLVKTESRLRHHLERLVEQVEELRTYVLIVEGKDDRAVWEQLLQREGVPVERVEVHIYGDGGVDEAIKLLSVFRGKKLRLIPHKLILDSDNNAKVVEEKLRDRQVGKESCYILKEKEIESYLLDEEAIARILSVDIEHVKSYSEQLRGSGKEKLDNIILKFTGHKPSAEMKGLIARALKQVPSEFVSVIEEICEALSPPEGATDDSDDYW
jgi:hypothetical protein